MFAYVPRLPQLPRGWEAWDPHQRQAARAGMVLLGWGGRVLKEAMLMGLYMSPEGVSQPFPDMEYRRGYIGVQGCLGGVCV